MFLPLLFRIPALTAFVCIQTTMAQRQEVVPKAMTSPMQGVDDVADDVCVWRNPWITENSVIIGINKSDTDHGGLYLFDLNGKPFDTSRWKAGRNWIDPGRKLNNVDIGCDFGSTDIDLVCASNRTDRSIDVFQVLMERNQFAGLKLLNRIPIGDGFAEDDDAPYGIAVDPVGETVVISDKLGRVAQFRLKQTSADGEISFQATRHDDAGAPWQISKTSCPIEGIVFDATHSAIYLAAEDEGIYRYQLKDGLIDVSTKVVVDRVGTRLTADVEGLTIYKADDGTGYLIASSQGSNRFVAYRREFEKARANAHAGSFTIVANGEIDAVQSTDGIDAVAGDFGPDFPLGLFIAHDGEDQSPTNYKLVPWKRIRGVLSK